MAALSRDRGIVLRTHDHAETDRIAVLLTPRGRLDLLAKGARRLEGSAGALLDPLHVLDVIYYRRRGLPLLKEAAFVQTFPQVRGDLDRAAAALRALRWAADLFPSGSSDERPYLLTLESLAALERGLSPLLFTAAYTLRALALAGHGPYLTGCVRCGGGNGLTWVPERGGFLCAPCGGSGASVSPRLARTLDALARLPLDALELLQAPDEDLRQGIALLEEFRRAQVGR
ncbi:MAG: DNA repair protein RecO [Candidatus Bipolaricaulota bacterium]|nr:DNA repair protein RecO [Candidatus Bipolaricaulota bacterium]